MRYLCVCSGIGAASAAWHELGWTPAAFAEVEKFPSALLAERYPGVPNLGDMTRFDAWPDMSIDLLVGGTPCQSFSVAGQRGSLADERGNLTLVFCRIADRFDPELIVWENVPGVLSTADNAFGCFLAELTGCDTAVVPCGERWTDAGVVAGPKRTAAWRVLNAEGFVPQRRSRVFVVCARAGSRFHPADVLFETEAEAFERLGERAYTGPLFPIAEGVRGDSEASDEAGQETAGALGAGSKRSGGRVGRREAAAGHLVAGTLRVRAGGGGGPGPDEAAAGLLIAHALRADGFDASEDGTGRGTPLIVANAEGGRSVNLTRSNVGKQIHNQSPLLVFAQNQRNEVRELEVAGSQSSIRRGDAKNETLLTLEAGEGRPSVQGAGQFHGRRRNALDRRAHREACRMSACKYCDAPIAWNRVAGNWKPTNADGSPHLCSAKVRIPDVNQISADPIRGPRYVPSCGKCDVPPWETCACSERLAA